MASGFDEASVGFADGVGDCFVADGSSVEEDMLCF